MPRKTKYEKIEDEYKIKKCTVIHYSDKTKNLDIDFDGYGIRIKNIFNFHGDSVNIKYCGTIGKPNFKYSIQED